MSIKKLLILSAASLVAVASTASFAGGPDAMSGPMPAAPAPAAMDWTGFYAGGNIGGAIGSAPVSNVLSGEPATNAYEQNALNAANNSNFNASSAIVGAQLGYNFEIPGADGFVVGLETNFDYMSQSTASTNNVYESHGDDDYSGANSIQTNWDYTLRGRLGYSFMDDTVMVYGTGGLALADLTYDNVETLGPGALTPNTGSTFSLAKTMIGWTAGGGLEWRFVPNWSLQGQYLYENLGTISQNQTYDTGDTVTTTQNASLTENVVTAAINYHF